VNSSRTDAAGPGARPRLCGILTLFGTMIRLLLILLPLIAGAAGNLPVLVPGYAEAGRLRPGAALSYRISSTGTFRILLQQGDWDFAIDILDRETLKVLRTVDAFPYESETATLIESPAVIRVRRVDSDALAADFSLSLVPIAGPEREEATLRKRAEDLSTSARQAGKNESAAGRQEAVQLSKTALELWRQVGDASATLRASLNAADSLLRAGKYEPALAAYCEALPSADSARSRAELLANRGSAYWRLGRFSEALADMRDSLSIWKPRPIQAGLGNVNNNLGLVLWELGRYDESLRAFRDAESAMETLGNRTGLAYLANNSALVEGTLGHWRSSGTLLEQAAHLFDRLGDKLAAGRAHTNSARIFLKLGDNARAESAVRLGLGLIGRSGNQAALAEGSNLLGEVLVAEGKRDDGMASFRHALFVATSAGDPRAQANALTNMGRSLLTAGGRDSGIAFLKDALRLWGRFGAPDVEASVLYHLAVGQRDAGRLTEARESIARALELTESLRSNVMAVDLRVGFLVDRLRIYDEAVNIFELSGDVESAWRAAEMARARGLYELLSAGRASNEQRQRLVDSLNAESARLARGSSSDAERARTHLDALYAELAQLAESGTTANALSPASLSSVQEALSPSAAILEFSAGESGYAWVIRRQEIFSFPLKRPAAYASAAARLAELMNTGGAIEGNRGAPELDSASATLAASLIWPALRHLKGVDTLIIAGDSRLDFPVAPLPMPAGGIVADRFETVEVPSAGSYVRLAARGGSPDRGLPIAIFADGVFSADDARTPVHAVKNQQSFPRLIFSGREAKRIASLAPPGEARLLLGFDDRKETLLSGSLSRYPVIHIATHFALRGRTPSLVFTLINADGSPRDGLVTPTELAQADLSANELLVFAACQSSAGPLIVGEGVQDLGRAALLAGSRRIILARWEVDDEASGAIFDAFYRYLWRENLSPAAALRRAQLSLRTEARFRSPYYWGAYYLVGQP
jgi:CHAT domain-containing protein/Tfp pilus assembly protein PilF